MTDPRLWPNASSSRPGRTALVLACLLASCALEGCKQQVGGPCEENSGCEVGLSCALGRCMTLRSEGEACASVPECLDGLLCLDKRCFAPRAAGKRCDRDVQCQEGLTCHGGRCADQAAIERSEKERAVRTKQTLRGLFGAGFSKTIDRLTAVANDEDAVWANGPDAAKTAAPLRGSVSAYRALAAAVSADEYAAVPDLIATAGVGLCTMLSTAAETQRRLTGEMKAAMTGHDPGVYDRLQRAQKVNADLMKLLRGLAKATSAGMEACLRTGPPEARGAAMVPAVRLRDGALQAARGKVATAFALEIKKLLGRTAAGETHAGVKVQMKRAMTGAAASME